MATRIYKTPFAATGDKEALATADQPDGKVSLQAGWTPDYELPNDNPNYRPVGRAEMNGVISEITEGLGEMQLRGFALWQAIDGGWPAGAQVMIGEVAYRSDINNNLTTPGEVGANWTRLAAGIATSAEVGAAENDTRTVTPLKLGQFFSSRIVQATEALLGIAKVATQAQTNAGTDDATIVTPKKLRDVFKGSNQLLSSTAGFQKFPGGLILQWGNASAVGGTVTVTFPFAFPNTNFTGLTTPDSPGLCSAYRSVSLSQCTLLLHNGSGVAQNGTVRWCALGN
ncbi:hypothetical protein A7J67_08245 [Achromobacter xylosoxidans]|nr:hypothetical protein A7J67_08245 [Achromobacter xylosoxidans]